MYIIIIGLGRVGFNLASKLISSGHDVAVIENKENLCNEAAEELDALIICGNGTDTKILEKANLKEADFFAAVTGKDEVNLLSCLLAKNYGLKKIIARVSDPSHIEAFKNVGIDYVISPELTAASYLEELITESNMDIFIDDK